MSVIDHIEERKSEAFGMPLAMTPLRCFAVITVALTIAMTATFAAAVTEWTVLAVIVTLLVGLNAVWVSGGAATALLGLFTSRPARQTAPDQWQPKGQTAILITLCGEDPDELATYLTGFTKDLKSIDLNAHAEVFVISDTTGAKQIKREETALAPLINAGHITYRRRALNTNRKPGNIADWLDTHSTRFDYMVVKDTDSRMTATSIRQMIWRLERSPKTGLLQAAISLIPGRSRFGRLQRTTSRLMSRNFGRGFASWSGKTSNYWGHNAIMRVAAFRTAATLPHLPGQAPFGGAILSHDFVEAATMRRAGWDIELAPDVRGSAEDAPQTLEQFFKRDRRWCQGNLQHIRVIAEPGLHMLSRFHLLTGIFSYLTAPIWLLLMVTLAFGYVAISAFWPLLFAVMLMLIPKLCGLADMLPRARTPRRRHVVLKAWTSELAVSSLIAPLILTRQALSVAAVVLGRDCGWKSPDRRDWKLPSGLVETAIGLTVLALALANGNPMVAVWLTPALLPLLSAVSLIPMLDKVIK